MTEFAPPLGQNAPVAQGTTGYKDLSPHFEHIDALTAIIGTVVAQLLQAGAPYTDTLGQFRPIVISSSGVTINNSSNHTNSLIFHDSNGGGADTFLGLSGTGALFAMPDSASSSTVIVAAADRTLTGSFYGLALVAGGTATELRSYAAGVSGSVWKQTHIVKTKAGAPVDGDFAAPQDGMAVLDTTNSRIYFRTSGTWKFAALT